MYSHRLDPPHQWRNPCGLVAWVSLWEAGLGFLLLLLLLLLLLRLCPLFCLHFLVVGDSRREGVRSRLFMLQLLHDCGEINARPGSDSHATRVVSSQRPQAVTAHRQELLGGKYDGPSTCLVFNSAPPEAGASPPTSM